uniref:RHS repeat domain-containing protein n=1 Tax=Rheinheimera sp. TaxID=1869214 RepID=UPI0040487BFC
MRYPNGLTVQYGYTPDGYLETVSNVASSYVYRTIDSQDAWGNILQASLGNGVHSDNRYHSDTGWVESLTAWRGSTRVHDVEYQLYDVYGNIRQVQNHVTGAAESYDYDELHRLTNSTYSNMGFTVPISYSYDAVGNLLSKTDYANTYRYGNAAKNLGGNAGSNAVRQVIKLNNSTVNFSYDNQGNLTAGDGLAISYNSFKQPTQITRNGNTFGFTYGANLERLKETRNGITTYEIDKLYEEESNGNWRIYLQDIAIIKYDATDKHQIRYTHKDRLGSTLTYTDHNGQVTDRRMFDAFGKPRATDGNSLTTPRLQNLSLSRNGFTDHRHLDEVELIHMNGRAYDYNLGRFLSVDPIIQSPGNSQSLNPYSYIMNNPLAGTDPTGYSAECAEKSCKIQVKVKTEAGTGSRISRTTTSTVTATQNSNGTVTISGSNGAAVGAVAKAINTTLTSNRMDIGSQSNKAQGQGGSEQAIAGGVAVMGRAATGGASATSTVAKAGSLARVNPVGLILTAMLPTKVGDGEYPISEDERVSMANANISNIANDSAAALQDTLQGKSSDDGLSLFRIAGGDASNLKLKGIEKNLSPPGISLLVSTDAQTAAAQFRSKFPNFSFSITGQASLRGIREAGFDVMADPTSNFVNHARLVHPAGVAGFNLENRQRLSTHFTNYTTP